MEECLEISVKDLCANQDIQSDLEWREVMTYDDRFVSSVWRAPGSDDSYIVVFDNGDEQIVSGDVYIGYTV